MPITHTINSIGYVIGIVLLKETNGINIAMCKADMTELNLVIFGVLWIGTVSVGKACTVVCKVVGGQLDQFSSHHQLILIS